jgi:protein phosphatase
MVGALRGEGDGDGGAYRGTAGEAPASAPAVAARSSRSGRPGSSLASEASPPVTTRRAPLAPAQGAIPPVREERHFGRLGKTVAALIAIIAVLFLVGGGGYLASRQLYFLGTNHQGIVTVYRGLPYTLPFGIPMYETFYVSGVPAAAIPVDRRSSLLSHNLRSQSTATNLINALERGKISG